jgi:hypothetical protein
MADARPRRYRTGVEDRFERIETGKAEDEMTTAASNVRDRIRKEFDRQVAGFETSEAFRRLESGGCRPAEYRDLIANVARAHLNSPRILAFLFAVAPPAASRALASNMLEELGAEGPESGHPWHLETLLERTELAASVRAQVHEDSADLLHRFCADPFLFGSLRELGLSVLLEVSSFEWMLSRLARRMGEALERGLGLDREALSWFFLHAEADLVHAQEALETIEKYVAGYGFGDEELSTFLDLTFRENVFTSRYFFKSYVGEAA